MPKKTKENKKTESSSLISREKLLSLYAGVLRCRMIEASIASSGRRAKTGASAAAAVAACIDQKPGDMIVAEARDLLPAIVQGKTVQAALKLLKKSPAESRKQLALRVARAANALRKHKAGEKRNIAVIFRGSMGNRQWQRLLETATAEKLAMILVDGGEAGAGLPRLPAIAADRDDAVAIYRVASEGIAHARRGNGPTLIECIRWEVEGSDEVSDPIGNMKRYLAQKGISPARRKAKVMAEFDTLNGK